MNGARTVHYLLFLLLVGRACWVVAKEKTDDSRLLFLLWLLLLTLPLLVICWLLLRYTTKALAKLPSVPNSHLDAGVISQHQLTTFLQRIYSDSRSVCAVLVALLAMLPLLRYMSCMLVVVACLVSLHPEAILRPRKWNLKTRITSQAIQVGRDVSVACHATAR
jgi:hypothetical protein